METIHQERTLERRPPRGAAMTHLLDTNICAAHFRPMQNVRLASLPSEMMWPSGPAAGAGFLLRTIREEVEQHRPDRVQLLRPMVSLLPEESLKRLRAALAS